MPLDVQPLSKRRQAMMILVILVLLGGSLGLAQVLIMRHVPPAILVVEFPAPPDVGDVPVNESAEKVMSGDIVEAAATWPQGERYFAAFFWEDAYDISPKEYIQAILRQALNERPINALHFQSKVLAHHAAWEAEIHTGQGENAVFAIIRLATVEDQIIAFCFSGVGVMTDADKEFFDDYCTRQVRVRLEHPPRG